MKRTMLFACMLLVMVSCKKDEAELGSSRKVETSYIDNYLLDFKKRLSQSTKNSEMMSISDAEWNMTALENFELCDASYYSLNMLVDTFYTTMNISNDSVSLYELNRVFEYNISSILNKYHSMDGDDKTIFSIKSIIENDNKSNLAKVTTISMMYSGAPQVPNPLRFGPTDYWCDFDELGKCGDYEGQCIGSDATIEMNSKLQHYIPIYACEDGKRIYFTDFEEFQFNSYNFDDCYDSPYPPFCLYVNEGNSNNCLSPEELNWYLDKILEIIEALCDENDKVLHGFYMHWDEYVGIDENRGSDFWSVDIDIAKANCTQFGAIL